MKSKNFCPNCGSEDVDLDDETHQVVCMDCGFSGAVLDDKHALPDEDEEVHDEEEFDGAPIVKKSVKKSAKKEKDSKSKPKRKKK